MGWTFNGVFDQPHLVCCFESSLQGRQCSLRPGSTMVDNFFNQWRCLRSPMHTRTGYRREHDLLRPEVREEHLLRARQGPENVAWVASPCTSYCDWALQNGGTRTFSNPRGAEGGPITQKERDGNTLSDFGAECFTTMLDHGGFPICESTAPSGRYPKQWHLPSWKRVLQRPDVDFVDLDMCAFGLGPPDAPGTFYRHATRVVFPRHEPLRQALLRVCPGVGPGHQHVPLKGNRAGVPVSRCTA